MKYLEKDSEKKFNRSASWGAIGDGVIRLFSSKKPDNPVPNGTPANLFHLLILVNNLSAADGIFDFSV